MNQKIDSDRDVVLSEEFATFSGLDAKRIVFDSDYVISYKKTEEKQDAGNESGFDKFFFQWSKGELDAVILTKDFLNNCTTCWRRVLLCRCNLRIKDLESL